MRVVAGHGVGPPVGRDDGRAGRFGQPAHLESGIAPLNAAASQDNRTLRGQEQLGGLVDQPQIATVAGLAGAVSLGRLGLQLHLGAGQEVAGYVQQHRSHAPRGGDPESVAQGVGQPLDAVDGEGSFGDGA